MLSMRESYGPPFKLRHDSPMARTLFSKQPSGIDLRHHAHDLGNRHGDRQQANAHVAQLAHDRFHPRVPSFDFSGFRHGVLLSRAELLGLWRTERIVHESWLATKLTNLFPKTALKSLVLLNGRSDPTVI